jgi:hypothetical protein
MVERFSAGPVIFGSKASCCGGLPWRNSKTTDLCRAVVEEGPASCSMVELGAKRTRSD